MALHNVITLNSFVTSGLNISNPPPLFVGGGSHLHKECPEKGNCFYSDVLQLPVDGGRQATSRELPGLQTCQKRAAEKEDTENTQNYHG
jgi:hypothetical protein